MNAIKIRNLTNTFLCIKGYPVEVLIAGLKDYARPPDFSNVELPEKPKLRIMEKVPMYPSGMRPPKCSKRLIDIRGSELVHNKFIHRQFGLIATTGGYLKHGHFEMIRLVINRKMDVKTMFAEWRVDPPWKPITKKSQGKRMGGGKADIHHYVTPVKAGRVIFEMGGKCQFEEVLPLLNEVAGKMPIKSLVASQEILDKIEAEEKRQEEENINPYTFKHIIESDLLSSHQWISTYDFEFLGKYR